MCPTEGRGCPPSLRIVGSQSKTGGPKAQEHRFVRRDGTPTYRYLLVDPQVGSLKDHQEIPVGKKRWVHDFLLSFLVWW